MKPPVGSSPPSSNKTQFGPQPSPIKYEGNPGNFGQDVFAEENQALTQGGIGDLLMPLFGWRGDGRGRQFDQNAALMGAQDKLDQQRNTQLEGQQLQNAILRKQLNPDRTGGGGIGGIQQGMDRNRQMSQQLFRAPSAYERASREKDLQEELRRRQLFGGIDLQQQLALQKQKMALAQQLFGQFSGGRGGGTLTNTDQQIVNNAGSWEPRNVTSTRQIPQTDIMAALSRFL